MKRGIMPKTTVEDIIAKMEKDLGRRLTPEEVKQVTIEAIHAVFGVGPHQMFPRQAAAPAAPEGGR